MSQRRGPTNGKSNGSGSGLGKFLLCCWPTQEEAVVHEEPMVQARTVQDKTPRITATPVQSVLTETLQVKTVPAKPTTIDHSQPKPIPVKPAQVGAPQAKAVPGQTTTSKGRNPQSSKAPSGAIQLLKDTYERKATELRAAAQKRLPSGTYDPLAGAPCLQDMLETVELSRAKAKSDKQKHIFFLEKIAVGLQRLEKFGQALDVLCQGSDIANLIWGGFRILIVISNDIFDTFDRIYEVLQGISESLPRFETYTKVFEQPDSMLLMAEPLCRIYKDIMEFCISTINLYESTVFNLEKLSAIYRARFKVSSFGIRNQAYLLCLPLTCGEAILGRSLWSSLSKEFGALTARLKVHSDEVDKMAIAAHMIDIHAFQKAQKIELKKQEQFRKEALLERDEQQRFREEMRLKLTITPQPADPQATKGISNLPGLLSPYFTGRNDQCTRLGQLLSPKSPPILSQKRAAVFGMPGVGKTQLALQFSTVNKDQFDNVFWVSGATYEKLNNGFQEIAELLNLPEKSRPEQHVKVQAVKRWLVEDTNRHWLLVIDNVDADDFKVVLDFIPQGSNGSLLFTTRKSGAALHLCGETDRVIELTEMNSDESCDLFLRAFGPTAGNKAHDNDLARKIVKDMGNLPLAIDQAAAFARIMDCSLEDYLEMYQENQSEVLAWNEEHSSSSASVMNTFEVALSSLEGKYPRVGKLICLFAFLDPEGIPLSILSEGSVGLDDPELKSLLSNKLQLETTLAQLKSVSLIRRVGKPRNVWMHDLFHAISRLRLAVSIQQKWAEMAVSLVWTAYDQIPFHWTSTFTNWDKNDEYLPHILSSLKLAMECGVSDSKSLAMMLERTTGYFIHRGRDDKTGLPHAITLGHQAVEAAKKAFGENDPAVMKAMSTLGYVYKCLRRSKEAEVWNRRALDLRNQILGPKHPDTLSSMFDLARDLRDQGYLDEAERLWRIVVEERGNILGRGDNETLWAMYMLAEVCVKQYHATSATDDTKTKRLLEAESLFVESIVGFEKTVGRNHAFTLICLRSLALTFIIQERYLEAKQLLEEAADGFIVIMGIDHVECEVTYYHLKRLYAITDLGSEVERLRFMFKDSSWINEHEERGEVTQILHNN